MRHGLKLAGIAAGIAFAGLAGTASDVSAQDYGPHFGAELLYGTDTDLGLGGRVAIHPIRNSPELELQGGFNIFFPDGDDTDFFEINGNLWYHLPLEDSRALPYIGGGLNIARAEFGEAENTDAGLNLGGGVRLPFENTAVFFEGRFTVGGTVEQFIIGGGVLFGGF